VGLDELPDAGDRLYVVENLARAKVVAAELRLVRRTATLRAVPRKKGLEELLASAGKAEIPVLNLIVKADVQGTLETLKAQLEEFPKEKVELRLLHAAVGTITEADVALAQASDAIVAGFQVVTEDRAREAADNVGVEIRSYRVIYEVLQDVQRALEGLLEPLRRQEVRGTAEVRQIFHVGRIGTIAGCLVTDGVIARNAKMRLVRDGRVVLEGSGVGSLRRFKDDVREVRAGFECGIKLESFDDLKPGDRLEAYEVVETRPSL
jgi:translation initiation factor IF-2